MNAAQNIARHAEKQDQYRAETAQRRAEYVLPSTLLTVLSPVPDLVHAFVPASVPASVSVSVPVSGPVSSSGRVSVYPHERYCVHFLCFRVCISCVSWTLMKALRNTRGNLLSEVEQRLARARANRLFSIN